MNNRPILSIVCALAEKNRAIGKNNQLLWHISEDLQNFKKLTSGHPIIMGQKTHESIGRVLPDRTNIVLTKNKYFKSKDCIISNSINEAINEAKKIEKKEIFIIGGGQIYAQTISMVDKLYLTLVHGEFEADTFFPDFSAFSTLLKEKFYESAEYKFKFVELIK